VSPAIATAAVAATLVMDDEISVRLAREQWTEAFNLVVARYQDKVFRLAYSMLGDRSAAEETVQETFIRIWRGLPNYRGASSVSTWVFSIARNTCLTALQSTGKRKMLSLDMPKVRAAAEERDAALPQRGSGIDLQLLLSRLPEKYRQILVLFYLEERSYVEVARILNLPMGTVKTNIHRARQELAEALILAKGTQAQTAPGKTAQAKMTEGGD